MKPTKRLMVLFFVGIIAGATPRLAGRGGVLNPHHAQPLADAGPSVASEHTDQQLPPRPAIKLARDFVNDVLPTARQEHAELLKTVQEMRGQMKEAAPAWLGLINKIEDPTLRNNHRGHFTCITSAAAGELKQAATEITRYGQLVDKADDIQRALDSYACASKFDDWCKEAGRRDGTLPWEAPWCDHQGAAPALTQHHNNRGAAELIRRDCVGER